ncbi:unnamed protein product [Prorocentrum cordatum]|nr:unnamed protein product [Polarella glacialis]
MRPCSQILPRPPGPAGAPPRGAGRPARGRLRHRPRARHVVVRGEPTAGAGHARRAAHPARHAVRVAAGAAGAGAAAARRPGARGRRQGGATGAEALAHGRGAEALLLLARDAAAPRGLRPPPPPSRLRDSPWPQLAFDPAEALACERGGGTPSAPAAADAYRLMAEGGASSARALWGPGEEAAPPAPLAEAGSGLPAPHAQLPLDAIHFVDSVQALSHVLTFLQEAPPRCVGVDIEWSDPHLVSLIQIATPTRAFVLDTVNRTPLYMSVLHCLMGWLLGREETTKLFFGFPQDLIRLNLLFEPHGRSLGTADAIASVVDMYTQRLQRVRVQLPRREDTPLGREGLLGEALEAEDLAEIHRLSSTAPAYPERCEVAEQVFLIGGHHSLAAMVERYLGEKLNKSVRQSNWNFRPLSAVQVIYAATDAHVLLRLEAAMRASGVLPQRTWGAAARPAGEARPAWWRGGVADGGEDPPPRIAE